MSGNDTLLQEANSADRIWPEQTIFTTGTTMNIEVQISKFYAFNIFWTVIAVGFH